MFFLIHRTVVPRTTPRYFRLGFMLLQGFDPQPPLWEGAWEPSDHLMVVPEGIEFGKGSKKVSNWWIHLEIEVVKTEIKKKNKSIYMQQVTNHKFLEKEIHDSR